MNALLVYTYMYQVNYWRLCSIVLYVLEGLKKSCMYFDFSGQKKIFEVISNVIDEELPSTMTAGINYAASPGVIIPLLMLLG